MLLRLFVFLSHLPIVFVSHQHHCKFHQSQKLKSMPSYLYYLSIMASCLMSGTSQQKAVSSPSHCLQPGEVPCWNFPVPHWCEFCSVHSFALRGMPISLHFTWFALEQDLGVSPPKALDMPLNSCATTPPTEPLSKKQSVLALRSNSPSVFTGTEGYCNGVTCCESCTIRWVNILFVDGTNHR